MTPAREPRSPGLLQGARVYLSGPMDFVESREEEMKFGWRNRVSEFLRARGCIVFDPWNKPEVRGLHGYGREDVDSTNARDKWTFAPGAEAAALRSSITGKFWETLHIDLRMVDTCDFVVAYCPTNIYSVGTPHEIVLARSQRKPVLLVSPPVEYTAYDELRSHLAGQSDSTGVAILERLKKQAVLKANPKGVPSLWYMPLVGGESFFDGFGFSDYRTEYGWATDGPLDIREQERPPVRPLLPFLAELQRALPRKWSGTRRAFVRNDDWLLWDLRARDGGADVLEPHKPPIDPR